METKDLYKNIKKNNNSIKNFIFLILLCFFCGISLTSNTALAEIKNISVSAVVGTLPSVDSVVSGGGNGGVTQQSGVRFSGFSYPNSNIFIKKGYSKDLIYKTDVNGKFSIVIPETNWTFYTLFAVDSFGTRSTILNLPTVFYSGYLTEISGIRFPPTVRVDKTSVKKGDFVTISGSGLYNFPIEIIVKGKEEVSFFPYSNKEGLYSITVPFNLIKGEYSIKARYLEDNNSSKLYKITVGDTTIFSKESTINIPGDCNFDQRIDLTDFSIMAFFFGKKNPSICVDLNRDGIINLVDFSIIAFYWNG